MTKQQFKQIWLVLSKVYTWFKAEDFAKLDVWYEFFKDDDYKCAGTAVKIYISENPKEPTIADLRHYLFKVTLKDIPTVDEAWGQIMTAASKLKSSQYFADDMPRIKIENDNVKSQVHPLALKIAENMGWYMIRMAVDTNKLYDSFRFEYNSQAKAAEKVRSRPKELQGEKPKEIV